MSAPARTLLTTCEAATFLGFKTTSAVRKAVLERRIVPAGRRCGRGPDVFEVAELERFMRREARGERVA